MVAIGMRRRAPPLIAAELKIAIAKHVFPRHEDIIEHDQRIGFVESRRQRIVEFRIRGLCVRPSGIDFHARRIGRYRNRERIGFVAGRERMNATDVDRIRIDRSGTKLLRPFQHNAIVAFGDDAGMQGWIGLLVRRFRAIDLRRNNRVRQEQMMIARIFMIGGDILRILLSRFGKYAALGRITGEKSRNVIGRAAHQAKRLLGPAAAHGPPQCKIGRLLGNMITAQHRRAGNRRWKGH